VSSPKRQEGYALATAMIMLGIMLTVGLGVVAIGDHQSKRSGEQRVRESSLNLTEGVLYGQGLVLATNWPSRPDLAYPAQCSEAQPAGDQCANRDTLAAANATAPAAAAFSATDFTADVTWTTKVRDDYGPLAADYDTTMADGALALAGKPTCAAPCAWDFNGNNKLWVQARAVVRGRPRNVVARLQLEKLAESIPQVALVSGAVNITNLGNSQLINDTNTDVLVRCKPNNGNNHRGDSCAGYDTGQILPNVPKQGDPGPLFSAEQLARFKQAAKTDGKLMGCPDKNADLSGAVVWVEGCVMDGEPSFSSSMVTKPCNPPAPAGMSQSCINQLGSPGVLIWHCGRSNWQGGLTFVGLIYMVNDTDGTCGSLGLPGVIGNGSCNGNNVKDSQDAFIANGGFGIWGALAVDGPGCAKIGSNGMQLYYDPAIFSSISTYGTVGLIQNTWRELAPNAGVPAS
jgi:Tfp pilus assembly protein PilX